MDFTKLSYDEQIIFLSSNITMNKLKLSKIKTKINPDANDIKEITLLTDKIQDTKKLLNKIKKSKYCRDYMKKLYHENAEFKNKQLMKSRNQRLLKKAIAIII